MKFQSDSFIVHTELW